MGLFDLAEAVRKGIHWLTKRLISFDLAGAEGAVQQNCTINNNSEPGQEHILSIVRMTLGVKL
jgi:hypothetical protein